MGGWPNAVVNVSKAGTYTGFTWKVLTDWNVYWAKSLFDTLSNNTIKPPNSLGYWFTQTPGIPKQYFYSEDNVTVKVQYAGHSDLTHWKDTSSASDSLKLLQKTFTLSIQFNASMNFNPPNLSISGLNITSDSYQRGG